MSKDATAGPWRVGEGPGGSVEIWGRMRFNSSPILASMESEPRKANAELICKAVNYYRNDWRADPSADGRWQAGCDFALVQLCEAIGVDPKSVRWDAATETLDGDVNAVIWNILRARFGDDWDPDQVQPPVTK